MNFLQFLNEAGVTFGGIAYPKSGNVVILAGGAGSGKGFVLNKILLVNGKVFDVDQIKTEVMSISNISAGTDDAFDPKKQRGFEVFDNDSRKRLKPEEMMKALKGSNINRIFKDYLRNHHEYGEDKVTDNRVRELLSQGDLPDVRDLMLGNPADTGVLHSFVDYLDLDKKKKSSFFGNLIENPNLEKPNVIFDITLKKLGNLTKIYNLVIPAGYDPKNIHLVWILNDINIARVQNIERGKEKGGRSVCDDILKNTHIGAAKTMKMIINSFETENIPGVNVPISEMIQGDVWIVPNQKKVDSIVKKSGNRGGGEAVVGVNKYKMKERGKPMKTLDDVENERYVIMNHENYLKDLDSDNPRSMFVRLDKGDLVSKINNYVPDDSKW